MSKEKNKRREIISNRMSECNDISIMDACATHACCARALRGVLMCCITVM